MPEPDSEEDKALGTYLRREYDYLGAEEVGHLLQRPAPEKSYYKAVSEQEKLLGVLLGEARIVRSLGPPFVPGALDPYARLTDKLSRRPFLGQYASREAAIRAGLLPHNLYFMKDMSLLREVFGLPPEGVREVPAEAIPPAYWWWSELAPLNVLLLQRLWTDVHTAKAERRSYHGPELPPFLPEFLRNYLAVPDVVPRPDAIPEWLQQAPQFPWGPPSGYKERLPLHRFLAVVLFRYRLPPRLFGRVGRYLFSNCQDDLLPARHGDVAPRTDHLEKAGLSWRVESVLQPGTYVQGSMTLAVQGIDAFTTEGEWRALWQAVVVPAQRAGKFYLSLSKGER